MRRLPTEAVTEPKEANMFDDWMRGVDPLHEPTDDGKETRLLRACWDAAVAEERAAGHSIEKSPLVRLMERAKELPPMTAEQLFEQRVSWAWSTLGNPSVTKDQVRAILRKREGLQ